jgi:hypothetical protein
MASKEEIVRHLVDEHNVSEAMLRRGGGTDGSSRSLSSLRQSLQTWCDCTTEEG